MKSAHMSSFVALALALHAHAYVDVEDGAFNVRHIHMVERGENGEIVGRAFGNTYSIVRRDEDDLEVRGRCQTVMACGTAGGCATMAGQRYCKGESWEKSFQKAISQTGANGITGLKMMAEGIGRGPVGMLVNTAKSTAKAIIKANKETKASKAAAAKKSHKSTSKKSTKKEKKSSSKKSASKKKGSSNKKAASKKASPSKKSVSKKSTLKKGSTAKKASASKRGSTAKKASTSKKASAPKKAAATPKKASAPKKAAAAPKKAAAPKQNAKSTQKKKRDLVDVVLNRRNFEVVERDEGMNLVHRSEYSIFDLATKDEEGSFVTRECEMYNGGVSCM